MHMKRLVTAAIALTISLAALSGATSTVAQPVDYDDASGSDGTCTSTGTANEQVTFCKEMREGNGQALSEPGYNPRPTPAPDPAPETESDAAPAEEAPNVPADNSSGGAVATATDQDADNLADDQEPGLGLDPTNADTDGDGVADGDEGPIYGTDPLVADTDGDGASDGNELFWTKTDPLVP